MADKAPFLTVVITSPHFLPQEGARISDLLRTGAADFVHLRKPDAALSEVKRLIEDVDISLRNRLRLHGHFALLEEFNLAGCHINSRCPQPSPLAASVSKSCHSLEELREAGKYAYVTLSPVFPSISKPGYGPEGNNMPFFGNFQVQNVIALGGVTPDKFPVLRQGGFAGAALLGYVWQTTLPWNEMLDNLITAKTRLAEQIKQ